MMLKMKLVLGNALDGSSGPPSFEPHFGHHETYQFGAHYFFEFLDPETNSTASHAACECGHIA